MDHACVTYILSLYTTATQNTWHRGLALGTAPDARILRWRYQHIGIFWRYLTLKFASPPTPTPDASQWNIGGVGSSGIGHVYFMYISCIFHVYFMYIPSCLCIIFCVGYAKISRCKGRFQWNMGFRFSSGGDLASSMSGVET